MVSSYVLVANDSDPGRPGILCLECGITSWHPADVDNLYCGNCKVFHQDLMERRHLEQMEKGQPQADPEARPIFENHPFARPPRLPPPAWCVIRARWLPTDEAQLWGPFATRGLALMDLLGRRVPGLQLWAWKNVHHGPVASDPQYLYYILPFYRPM